VVGQALRWPRLIRVALCSAGIGIPAIITGIRALRDIDASDGFLRGTKTAWTGIVLGVIGTLGFGGYLVMTKG
jgi:hypothetical protein